MNLTYGVLRLADVDFAIEATALQEVIDWPEPLVAHPNASGCLLGLFDLRGVPIPLIELPHGREAGATPREGRRHVAVIRQAGGHFAIAVDGVVDMIKLGHAQFVALHAPDNDAGTLFNGIAVIGERLIYRLDLAALMRLPGMLFARSEGPSLQQRQRTAQRSLKHYLIFVCDARHYAMDASAVTALVDQPVIVPGDFRSDASPGIAQVRGASVPVLHLTRLLGLDAEPIGEKAQLLVLSTPDGARFGLGYDRLVSLARQAPESLGQLPQYGLRRAELFAGVLTFDGDRQAMLLDHAALSGCEVIGKIARLYHAAEDPAEGGAESTYQAQQACLVYRAPYEFVSPLTQIQEIVQPPAQLIGFPQPEHHLLGFFDVRGETVPLIWLNGLLDAEPDQQAVDPRVLLVRGGRALFGLMVTGIDSIDAFRTFDSERLRTGWQSTGGRVANVQDHARSMVSIGGHGRSRVATLVDLCAVVERLERAGLC